MPQPANPASFFISGSESKEFTYKPGNKLFYVTFTKSNYMAMTFLVHANSFKHVKTILKELVKFESECHKEYSCGCRGRNKFIALATYVDEHTTNDPEWKLTIDIIDKDKLLNTSWASNDTF